MPSEEQNCHALVTVTGDDVTNSVKVIPRLETLVSLNAVAIATELIQLLHILLRTITFPEISAAVSAGRKFSTGQNVYSFLAHFPPLLSSVILRLLSIYSPLPSLSL